MLTALLPLLLLGAPAAAQDIVTESDIAALPPDEAYRLMFVVPGGADWPSGTVLQWEANRGHLRLYLTNRRDDTLYLDWSRSHFIDPAGKTWPLRAATQEYATRDAIEPGQMYQESLALVGGPGTLYGPRDVGRPMEVTLYLGGAEGFTAYQERFDIGMNLDQVARSLAAEERHHYEFQKRRTVTATVLGTALAGAGIYLLADERLGYRNGVLDTEMNTTRLALGGGGLGLGFTLVTASSIRRATLSKKIAALETYDAPME